VAGFPTWLLLILSYSYGSTFTAAFRVNRLPLPVNEGDLMTKLSNHLHESFDDYYKKGQQFGD
jgi:hypothetical protein